LTDNSKVVTPEQIKTIDNQLNNQLIKENINKLVSAYQEAD
jgi:hypothetical protein